MTDFRRQHIFSILTAPYVRGFSPHSLFKPTADIRTVRYKNIFFIIGEIAKKVNPYSQINFYFLKLHYKTKSPEIIRFQDFYGPSVEIRC